MNRNHVPMRRCAGCMQSKPKTELVRIAAVPGTDTEKGSRSPVYVDPENRFPGRGAYLCRNRECFEAAKKRRAINRTLKREVLPEDYERIGEFFDKF